MVCCDENLTLLIGNVIEARVDIFDINWCLGLKQGSRDFKRLSSAENVLASNATSVSVLTKR